MIPSLLVYRLLSILTGWRQLLVLALTPCTVAGTHEGPCCHPHCTGINIQSDLTHVTARQYAGQGAVSVVRELRDKARY